MSIGPQRVLTSVLHVHLQTLIRPGEPAEEGTGQMEQPLKPMSPPLVAQRPRSVNDDRSRLKSVKISFPVHSSLCLLHCVSFVGCQEDTRGVSARRGAGVGCTPGRVPPRHPGGCPPGTRYWIPTL